MIRPLPISLVAPISRAPLPELPHRSPAPRTQKKGEGTWKEKVRKNGARAAGALAKQRTDHAFDNARPRISFSWAVTPSATNGYRSPPLASSCTRCHDQVVAGGDNDRANIGITSRSSSDRLAPTLPVDKPLRSGAANLTRSLQLIYWSRQRGQQRRASIQLRPAHK